MAQTRWLALDLSSKAGEISLGEGDVVRASAPLEGPRHSEALIPALSQLLDGLGWKMDDFGALYGSAGPGGFTGMRVALATLKGFALALELPLHLVASPEALALAHRLEFPRSGPLWVLVRAGAQRWGLSQFDEKMLLENEGVSDRPPASCPAHVTLLVAERWKELPEGLAVTVRSPRAGDLPRVASQATTLVSAHRAEEMIHLSPRYFALNYKKWDRPIVTFDGAETKPQSPTKTSTGAQTPPTPG